uniref:Uncharacterized protein n=1 Tax=Plectus sambesii TaxID=2011161 RepID=A0A914UZN1_9BILA
MASSFNAPSQLNITSVIQDIPGQSLSCISSDETRAIFFDFDNSSFLSIDLNGGWRRREWTGRMYRHLEGAKTVSKMHAITVNPGVTIVLMFGFAKRSERFFVASYGLDDTGEKSILIDEHLLSISNPSYRRQQTTWQQADGTIYFVVEWYSYQPDKTWFSVVKIFIDEAGRVNSKVLLNEQHVDFHSEQSFKFIADDYLQIFTDWSGGMPNKLLRRALYPSATTDNEHVAIKVDDCLSKLQKLEKRWQCVPQIVCGQTLFYVRSREEKTGEFWSLKSCPEGLEWIYHGEFTKTVQSWNILPLHDGSLWLHSNKSENGSPALFQLIQLQLADSAVPLIMSPGFVTPLQSPGFFTPLPSPGFVALLPSPLRETQNHVPSQSHLIKKPTILAVSPPPQELTIAQSIVNLPERSLPCLTADGHTAVLLDIKERSFVTVDLASGYRTGEFKDQPYKELDGGKVVLDALCARVETADETVIVLKFGFERVREKFFVASYQLDYSTLTTTLLHEHILPVDNPSYRRHQTLHRDENGNLHFVIEWYSYQPDKTWFHVIRVDQGQQGRIVSEVKLNAHHVDFHTGHAFKFVYKNSLYILTTWYAGMPTKLLKISLNGNKKGEMDITTKDVSSLSEKRWKCVPQAMNNQILFYMHSETDKLGEIWSLNFKEKAGEAEWILHGRLKNMNPKNIIASQDGSLWLHRDQDDASNASCQEAYFRKINIQTKQPSPPHALLSPNLTVSSPKSPEVKQEKPVVPPRKSLRPTLPPPPPPVPKHTQPVTPIDINSPVKKISLPEEVKSEGPPLDMLDDLRQRLSKIRKSGP